jgi:hypothetical protein
MVPCTWKDTKGHHWFDKKARSDNPVVGIGFGDFKTPMTGSEHVRAHRITKVYGPIGAIADFEFYSHI